MFKKPSDIRAVILFLSIGELTLSLSLSHPQKTKPSCGVPMMADSRVPKLEVPNFVKNQKWDLNPVNAFLVKPKLASTPGCYAVLGQIQVL
jgi:hypothetical protein